MKSVQEEPDAEDDQPQAQGNGQAVNYPPHDVAGAVWGRFLAHALLATDLKRLRQIRLHHAHLYQGYEMLDYPRPGIAQALSRSGHSPMSQNREVWLASRKVLKAAGQDSKALQAAGERMK